MIENHCVDQGYLESLESVNNPFGIIDYRVYTEIKEDTLPQHSEGLSPLYT